MAPDTDPKMGHNITRAKFFLYATDHKLAECGNTFEAELGAEPMSDPPNCAGQNLRCSMSLRSIAECFSASLLIVCRLYCR